MIAADELISYFVDISKQGVLRSALVHLFRLASVLYILYVELCVNSEVIMHLLIVTSRSAVVQGRWHR
jgi:hypothetical protein